MTQRKFQFTPQAAEKQLLIKGLTLLELLISISILSVLVTMLFGALVPLSNLWIEGERRIDTHQRARGALEMMARELTPAVVDTRMQLVILPGSELEFVGATFVVPESPALIWMAPIGNNGEIRCVGYYLYRDELREFYRLKRIHASPEENPDYFPRLINREDTRDQMMRTDPTSASWFLESWDEDAFDEDDPTNDAVIVSSATDGVIGFWVQSYDLLGNPIPWVSKSDNHPSSNLIYNSAAYFQMATTNPFDNGESFTYLSETPFAMKGNRVPAEIEISLVTIDQVSLDREMEIPHIQNVFLENGALDMEKSVADFVEQLKALGLHRAEVFTTRVKLVNGS